MTLDFWCLTAGCHIVIPTQISPNLCTSLVTVQTLKRAFRWLFFPRISCVCVCVVTWCNEIHTCVHVSLCLHVHIFVCTQAHLIRLVCECECVWPCARARVFAALQSESPQLEVIKSCQWQARQVSALRHAISTGDSFYCSVVVSVLVGGGGGRV